MPRTTARARRIGIALREHRNAVGMTLDQAADLVTMTRPTLARLENGTGVVRPMIVRALLTAYGVDGDERETLVELSKEARESGWWRAYSKSLPGRLGDLIALESDAAAISTYEASIVPGLVQTADYARAVMRDGWQKLTDEEIERRVEARLRRQARLVAPDLPEVCVIIDEAVLRRPVGGPGVMTGQLNRLIELSSHPNITVQVIPFSAGAHPGLPGSLAILDFADSADASIAYLDTVAGDMILDKHEDLRRCFQIFGRLRSLAITPELSESTLENTLPDYKE